MTKNITIKGKTSKFGFGDIIKVYRFPDYLKTVEEYEKLEIEDCILEFEISGIGYLEYTIDSITYYYMIEPTFFKDYIIFEDKIYDSIDTICSFNFDDFNEKRDAKIKELSKSDRDKAMKYIANMSPNEIKNFLTNQKINKDI